MMISFMVVTAFVLGHGGDSEATFMRFVIPSGNNENKKWKGSVHQGNATAHPSVFGTNKLESLVAALAPALMENSQAFFNKILLVYLPHVERC